MEFKKEKPPSKNSLDVSDKLLLTIWYIVGVLFWLLLELKISRNETFSEWALFSLVSITTLIASYKGFKRIWFK